MEERCSFVRRCGLSNASRDRFAGIAAVAIILTLTLLVPFSGEVKAQQFIRGDVTADGIVNEDDLCVYQCYFYGGTCAIRGWDCSQVTISCELAMDANDDDGVININDMIKLVSFIAMGGAPPPAPFPDCGPDPTNPQQGTSCCEPSGNCCVGLAGNIDNDVEGLCDIGDLTALIVYLYIPPNPEPICMEEANIDGDSEVLIDIGDLTELIKHLYIPPNPDPAACP